MHWPAVRALARLFPGRLLVNALPQLREILVADAELGGTFWTPFEEQAVVAQGPPEELRGCDLFLVMNDWDSPFLDRLLELVAPAASVGYDACCDHVLPRHFRRNNVDISFDIPAFLAPDLQLEAFSQPLRLPPEALAKAREIRSELPPGWRVLAVHPETADVKNVPAERWTAVLDAFLAGHPDWCALLLGRRDNELHRRGAHADRIVPCMGMPMAWSMSVVATADLFLGIDSSMMHVADLQRVPGVGIFGLTDPGRWGFRFAVHEHVVAPEHNLARLQPEPVVQALDRVLARAAGDPAAAAGPPTETTSMEMTASARLSSALRTAVERYAPTVVIETGTYEGRGSTRLVAEAFGNRPPRVFYTMEVSKVYYQRAVANLAELPYVRVLWGLSVGRAEAEQFLAKDEELNEDERAFYRREVRGLFGGASGSEDAPERLLERVLRDHRDECPMIVLDSAGGIGWLEFQEVLRIQDGRPFVLVLDDIDSVKHARTVEALRERSDFFPIDVYPRNGWLVGACGAEHLARVPALP